MERRNYNIRECDSVIREIKRGSAMRGYESYLVCWEKENDIEDEIFDWLWSSPDNMDLMEEN